MRTWSRGLRDLAVHAAAGVGLALAVIVMTVVMMSTAATGDERATDRADGAVKLSSGAGFTDRSAKAARKDPELRESGANNPSRLGIALGLVVLVGGLAVLGWGARRPKPEPVDLDGLLAE